MKMSKAILIGSVVVACIIIFSGLLMLIPVEIKNVEHNWWTGTYTVTYIRPYADYCLILLGVGFAVDITGLIIAKYIELEEMKSNAK